MQDPSYVLNIGAPVRVGEGMLAVLPGDYREPGRILNEYELLYVRRGLLYVEEGEQQFTVGPGQTLIYAPGVFHKAHDTPEDPLECYWVRFSLPGRPGKGAAKLELPRVATIADPLRMQQLWRALMEEKSAKQENKTVMGLIVAQMLCEVARAESIVKEPSGSAQALAFQARAYIQEHYQEAISASTISQALDCNRSYMNRVFHRTYGKTVTEYICDVRMFFAQEILIRSHISITETAVVCGFRDRCYFRRVFVRRTGLSPMAYRKRYGKVPTNL